MILASHGIIGSSIVQFVPDSDAQAFFDRVTTAGGSLSNTEKLAVNQLVLDMKDDGIWTKMKAIYPFVGASAAACAQNLKSSSFTGTFTSGWNFTTTGIQSTSNAYMNTTYIPQLLDFANFSWGIYMRTNTGVGNTFAVAFGASQGSNRFFIAPRWTGFSNVSNFTIGQGANEINASGPNPAGFFLGSRTALNAISSRRNNTSLGSNTIMATSFGLTIPLYIGCQNDDGVASSFNRDEYALAYISESLSNLEMDLYYTAVQAFQETLNREV
jgi:hypothetical protein